MWVLGVDYSSHDASASLIKDGEVIIACEEERFNREKHTKKFPKNAIRYCLDYTGITLEDIDRIAFFIKPSLHYRLVLYNLIQGFPKSILYTPYGLKIMRKRYKMKSIFKQIFKSVNLPPIVYVNHHLAHAASAFYLSPFERATILTIDGRGEYETITISIGERTKIKKLYSVKYPHSVGYLYSMVTKYLGFKPQHDEYKVMGLAAYGTSVLCDEFRDLAYFDNNENFRLNLDYFDHHYLYGKNRRLFSRKFVDKFGPPRFPNEPITQRHMDIAFSLQKLTEEIIVKLVKLAYTLTHEKNLCIAGGVALNCVANARILETGIFKKVFIQPAANDAGTSLGAGLYSYYQTNPKSQRKPLRHAFLGPSFSREDILATIDKFRNLLDIKEVKDVCRVGAELIHRGFIVGWFQGRMEYGPRALGNRSILATPSDRQVKEIVNSKVKFREEFRPFAPAVLAEYANAFFDCLPEGEYVYPYMLATAKVKPQVANKIPAVVHVDGTARVQIIHKEHNPLFWKLIQEYQRLSGVPVVLNTSFNTKGEPIVCSPEDAIKTFLETNLEYVIIEKYLLKKR